MSHESAHIYKNVALEKGKEYYEYENAVIEWTTTENYELIKRLGRGRYSEVFLAMDLNSSKERVLKILKPVKLRKIKREVKVLQILKDGENIVKILDMVKGSSAAYSIVLEYFEHQDYDETLPYMKLDDMKTYFREVLKAIEYCHSKGIMHRDVKLHNILYNKPQNRIKLIDFGLAEFYIPNTAYNIKVASKNYKSPELLVKYKYYDYALDMWSFGCVAAAMIFDKNPFFNGINAEDQLVKIVEVLGMDGFSSFLKKYDIEYTMDCLDRVGLTKKTSYSSFMSSCNMSYVTDEAIDFVNAIFVYDHRKRLTARDALEHRFLKIESTCLKSKCAANIGASELIT